MASAKRRSIFADRLSEFADFASGDEAAFARRGRWREFFRSRVGDSFDGRVIVEIGCSNGATLSAMAAKHPTSGFVGIDWKAKQLFLGAEQVAATCQRNIALLRARAQDLRQIFTDKEVDEILIFHPEPPQDLAPSQSDLITEGFLLDAHAVLRAAGTISLKTDHVAYYQRLLSMFGLPEPDWAAHSPASRPRLADLLAREDLLPVSDTLCRHFNVSVRSPNFWHDRDAMAHTAARVFAGEVTLFEQRFIRKRQPIFYFELQAK